MSNNFINRSNFIENSKRFYFKFLFKLNYYAFIFVSRVKLLFLINRGLNVGKNTKLEKCRFTWPNNVSIGEDCNIEEGVYFKCDGPYFEGKTIIIRNNVFVGGGVEFNIRKKIYIESNCLIASGCRFIDHDHGFASRDSILKAQLGQERVIELQDNVWLGVNVVVLKGVIIGSGAIVGAGSVVTRSIPAFEIWAGVPARKIGDRP